MKPQADADLGKYSSEWIMTSPQILVKTRVGKDVES